jgi:uncharacterized membrane protein YdjX (TVP38/TMEM64 family)
MRFFSMIEAGWKIMRSVEAWNSSMFQGLEFIQRNEVVLFLKNLPAGWYVMVFLVAPLFGFPVSVLLLLSGLRFGFAGGMTLAAVAMMFHHVVVFHLVHGWLRRFAERLVQKAGYRIPEVKAGDWMVFTAGFAAIHGPPYMLKVYLLALTQVPFWIYFGVGVPVYVIFCAIPVGLGSSVVTWNPLWVYAFLFAVVFIPLISWRLRQRFRKKANAGGGWI